MSRLSKSSRRITSALVGALILYLSAAYVVVPDYWRHYERQRGLATKAMFSTTALGIPGDVLNVGLEARREEIFCAMKAAGWRPADPVTFRSSLKIVGGVLARRAYPTAPVSDLFWEGRKEDLAFEKPSGVSPSHRHHVRFWLALDKGEQGAPVWLGGATFDRSVGVSHYTGQVTHHIAADIDAERETLIGDLVASGHVAATYSVAGVGPTVFGRNGGGDPYFTDGEVAIARLAPQCEVSTAPPEEMPTAAEPAARRTLFGWLGRIWRAVTA